jgi:1,4-dihydroxy-2-naphthoate polyprenyltransferase
MSDSSHPIVSGPKKWILGARPRTLPAAVVPVAVGGACASGLDSAAWWRLALALVVSIALQVGVNYANDYSDGVRGTDEDRVGPMRLVGSGVASPSSVKMAAFVSFGVAAVAGLVLALVTTLWLLIVGVAAIVSAWTYTGGPKPYGYAGLGEVFVFVFFGVVATVGSQFVVAEMITATSWIASIAVGAYACALLVINNLRDIPGDTAAGKRTLAVKIGDGATRKFFALLVLVAVAAVLATATTAGPFAMLGLVGVFTLKPSLDAIAKGAKGQALIPVLGAVGKSQMMFGVTYTVGLVLSLSA